MAEITTSDVRAHLEKIQGQTVTLDGLRRELGIVPGTKSFSLVRNIMFRLVEQKVVKPLNRGEFKVITQVRPVQVYGRERRPPVKINFPKDYNTMSQIDIGEYVTVREGDLFLISGLSNQGKTGLCLNFCAENLESHPILMGNEYTTIDNEPQSRFLSRLDRMDWVQWANGNGEDKFTLLPVRDDYAEYVVKDKLNIIDWINIDTEFWMISRVMEGIKRALGRGVAIIAIQKGEGAAAGRGGQFTKDFADVELLLDKYSETEILMTVGKVKESTQPLSGKVYAFGLRDMGVKIVDFRALRKCGCHKGWRGQKKCEDCNGTGYTDA